jgi:transposase
MAGSNPKVSPIVARKALAKHLYNQGRTLKSIAEEIGVSSRTVGKWLKAEGIPASLTARKLMLTEQKEAEDREKTAHLTPEVAAPTELGALDNLSPADQYQQYVAELGIKMMRDSVGRISGPKNVKEMAELDQIIRRNLGLNARSGGGAGKNKIDISILIKKPTPNNVIDVESTEVHDTQEPYTEEP